MMVIQEVYNMKINVFIMLVLVVLFSIAGQSYMSDVERDFQENLLKCESNLANKTLEMDEFKLAAKALLIKNNDQRDLWNKNLHQRVAKLEKELIRKNSEIKYAKEQFEEFRKMAMSAMSKK